MPYYITKVKSIPSDEPRSVEASLAKDEWFRELLTDALSEDVAIFDATLLANIARSGRSIEVTGGVYLKLDVECNRCLKTFRHEEQVSFRLLLEPSPEKGGKAQNDEDMNEAVDFSYYSGDEVDIGELVRQHILINQPISYLCGDECKGLCPKCGKDLNKGRCSCKAEASESPFAVLKDLK